MRIHFVAVAGTGMGSVAGLFQELLSVQALAQMQVAQHSVIGVPFQQGDGGLAVDGECDAGGAGTGKDVAQDAAHTLVVLDDEEAVGGKVRSGQTLHGQGKSSTKRPPPRSPPFSREMRPMCPAPLCMPATTPAK